jgi:hypothetical protein
MKTTQIMTKATAGRVNKARQRVRLRCGDGHVPSLSARTQQSRIQWPTEQQIQEVSKRLTKISQKGIRREVGGDYFNSGDLAYQLQEIIRATAELFKKSQRIKS